MRFCEWSRHSYDELNRFVKSLINRPTGIWVAMIQIGLVRYLVTVRLSERERKALKGHGKISEVVREALRLYLSSRNSSRTIARLRELQKNPVRTTIGEDLKLLRADRDR